MIENFSKVKGVKLLLSFVLSLITITWANASHLRAGEITVERRNCNSREVWITITVYTNTASDVKFGEDGTLYFGDGTYITVPRVENTPQPQLGPNIGIASYTVRHTYGSLDSYLISYIEPNRNGGVLNMSDSFWTTFYLETRFSLAVMGCNYSPKLKIPPIDRACAGVAFYHNPGAYDFNPVGPSDSISYQKVDPYRDRGLPVAGYKEPHLVVGNSKSESGGAATYTIDPVDGTMIWDAPSPSGIGEYNVAFIVIEWRKINGVWQIIGYVRRDMQIVVFGDCENKRPFLIVPDDTCVVAGAHINKDIKGYDRNDPPNPIRLQAYSEVLEFPIAQSPARIIGDTVNYVTHLPPDSLAVITFDWNTICGHIKGQPYDVVFKVTNDPPPYPPPPDPHIPPNLATFETWKITVIAPAPVLNTAVVQAPRNVLVSWTNYECASIADQSTAMQIWRKVDDTNYTPANCDTGMPPGLGFTLIATVPLTNTQFLDTNNGLGLERGVKYCYRLVAVFGDRGAESYVSNEVCMDPIDIAAPLITKVTVDQTSEDDGEITVSWLPPLNNFEIRPTVEYQDYQYQLERAEGEGFIAVSSRILGTSDSTAVISAMDPGLNTLDRQYFYRVMLYIGNSTIAIDSSSIASSVRLTLTTSNRVINLAWKATVPWSNQVYEAPPTPRYQHRIYSVPVGATTLADTTLIEAITVTEDGLKYTQSGLDSTQNYCYVVQTRGSYGNEDERVEDVEPLKNFSQINCAIPIVVEPPCAPVIAAFADLCEDYFENYTCSSVLFEITVRWSQPEDCTDEIVAYEVYDADPSKGYLPIATVTDTFAIFNEQSSLASCYWIVAINRAGAKSAASERVCSENCPNYELPNVFTPNGDNCNDRFSAFGVTVNLPEGFETCESPKPDDPRCARFVDRVDFKVFNRWGREVYDYVGQRSNENSIYIEWDGRDKSGKELAAGIYYYSADVTFRSATGGNVKTIKGWVHLVR